MPIEYRHDPSPWIQSLVAFGAGYGSGQDREDAERNAQKQRDLMLMLQGLVQGAQKLGSYYTTERHRKEDFRNALEKIRERAALQTEGRTDLETLRHKNALDKQEAMYGLRGEEQAAGAQHRMGLEEFRQGQYSRRARESQKAIRDRTTGQAMGEYVTDASLAQRDFAGPQAPDVPIPGVQQQMQQMMDVLYPQYVDSQLQQVTTAAEQELNRRGLVSGWTKRQLGEMSELQHGLRYVMANPDKKLKPQERLAAAQDLFQKIQTMRPAGTKVQPPPPVNPEPGPGGYQFIRSPKDGTLKEFGPQAKDVARISSDLYAKWQKTWDESEQLRELRSEGYQAQPFDQSGEELVRANVVARKLLGLEPVGQPVEGPQGPPQGPPGAAPPPMPPDPIVQLIQSVNQGAPPDAVVAEVLRVQPVGGLEKLDELLTEKYNEVGELTQAEKELLEAMRKAKGRR